MGIFSKCMNDKGVIVGMILGIVFIVVYIIYFKFVNLVVNMFDNWWFGIFFEGIGILGMMVNFIVVFFVFKVIDEVLEEI